MYLSKHWIEAEVNTTHTYNPDYKHEDTWENRSWCWRILSDKTEDYEERRINRIRIKTDKTVSIRALDRSLQDYFVKGCSCEHDCCGHWFGGLDSIKRPKNRKKNEYMITVSYSQNY